MAIPVAGLLFASAGHRQPAARPGVVPEARDSSDAPEARSRHEHRAASVLFVVVLHRHPAGCVPLAFATGAVAVMFAYALFGLPGLTLVISRVFTLMATTSSCPCAISWHAFCNRAGVPTPSFRAVHVWFGGCPAVWRSR